MYTLKEDQRLCKERKRTSKIRTEETLKYDIVKTNRQRIKFVNITNEQFFTIPLTFLVYSGLKYTIDNQFTVSFQFKQVIQKIMLNGLINKKRKNTKDQKTNFDVSTRYFFSLYFWRSVVTYT